MKIETHAVPPSLHPFVWDNDAIRPAAEAWLSPFQSGLLTGWGLFSTLRIYQGVPFALEAHWERLCRDGARLHVAIEDLWPQVTRGFAQLIARNQALEAVARIYFIRNRGGLLDAPAQRPTDLWIFTRGLRTWSDSARLRLQPHGRHAQAPLAGTKTLTWAHNLVLVEDANQAGFDDVLLLNERGELAECTAANVFLIRGGRLLTPPLDSGALPGVSRRVLLEAAPRYGLPVDESPLTVADLHRCEEIFITSSTREVQSVSAIAGSPLGELAFAAGPVTAKVAAIFHSEVQRYVAAHASAPATAGV